jgi:NAD+ kinase
VVTVALVAPQFHPEAQRLLSSTASLLEEHGHRAFVVAVDALEPGAGDGLSDDVELVVSLGGDGTFLRAAAAAHQRNVPILGANFGRLGYLLHIEPDELWSVLSVGLADGFTIEERSVLDVRLHDGARFTAINEVAIEKREPGHMLRLSTMVDDEAFVTYAADGIVVATPTGSTAYNLSAGGPVLDPTMRASIVTPVSPHLAVDRSIVLPPERVVRVFVDDDRGAVAVVDGRFVAAVATDEAVEVALHATALQLVVHASGDTFGRLRSILSPTDLRP